MFMRHLLLTSALLLAGGIRGQASLNVIVELNKPPGPDARLRMFACPGMNEFELEAGCVEADVVASAPVTRVLVPDMKPGVYAIKVFVDDNANGKLDQGWLEIPEEPYGFSNNARRIAGPPTFELAKFEVLEGVNTHRITLR